MIINDIPDYVFQKYYDDDYDFAQYEYDKKSDFYDELLKFQMDKFYYIDDYENEMKPSELNSNYLSQYEWNEYCLYITGIISNFTENFTNLFTNNINLSLKIIHIDEILDTYLYYINELFRCSNYWGIHEELENELIISLNTFCCCIQDYYYENPKLRTSSKRLNFIDKEICMNDIISIKCGIEKYMTFKKLKDKEYYQNKKQTNQKNGISIDTRKEKVLKRKEEILSLIHLGFSNSAIANNLGITKQAVGKFINNYNLRVNPNY